MTTTLMILATLYVAGILITAIVSLANLAAYGRCDYYRRERVEAYRVLACSPIWPIVAIELAADFIQEIHKQHREDVKFYEGRD